MSTTTNASSAVPTLAICFLSVALAALTVRAQESPTQPQPSRTTSPDTSPNSAKSVPVPAKQSGDAVSEKPNAKAFHSAQAAAAALYAAALRNDTNELLIILGPHSKDLVDWSADPNAPDHAQDRELFVHKYDQMHRLVKEPDDTVALYVGPENWPMPIPIVEYKGAWYFDTDLGKQEILYRQLGRNEMEALNVSRALIDAEKDYYATAHTYTSKFTSADGTHDGLYWNNTGSGPNSPIGPYLALAGFDGSSEKHECFHGYFYRVLLQSPVAPDGDAKSAANHANANNNFVIIAFPAAYRTSGVMTFLMDENGNAYEKDLGPTTAANAVQINSAQLDNTWNKVE